MKSSLFFIVLLLLGACQSSPPPITNMLSLSQTLTGQDSKGNFISVAYPETWQTETLASGLLLASDAPSLKIRRAAEGQFILYLDFLSFEDALEQYGTNDLFTLSLELASQAAPENPLTIPIAEPQALQLSNAESAVLLQQGFERFLVVEKAAGYALFTSHSPLSTDLHQQVLYVLAQSVLYGE